MLSTATVLQWVGLLLVAVGAGLVYLPAGVIVAGVGLVLFGFSAEVQQLQDDLDREAIKDGPS